jgi:hypothetical protein
MITSDQAFDLLVESSPSYFGATDLDRFVAAFEEVDDPDLFVRISAFAHHLVDLIVANQTDEVHSVFGTVELVELGLIEAIQNIVSHADVLIGPDRVVPLLGPSATKVWNDHEHLWNEAGRWRHDGPRVEQVDYDNIIDPNLRRYFQASKRRLDDGALISASDIVHYQTEVRNISPLTPAGRPRIPWPAVVVGLVLALCVAVALYRS